MRMLRLVTLLTVVVLTITKPALPQMSSSDGAIASETVPLVGIANITFKVSDLDKARAYYQGVLGLPEAFDIKDASGKTISAYFKINDDQYIEVTPNLKPGELIREARVAFQSSDLEKLHAMYVERGLQPGRSKTVPTGIRYSVVDPKEMLLDFLQYRLRIAADSCSRKVS